MGIIFSFPRMGPKWEELNMDCLVNILSRVGMESLLLDVPYVCKSWYKATCNPQCWSTLDFEESLSIAYLPKLVIIRSRLVRTYRLFQKSSLNKLIKYVAKRGNKYATYMKLPDCITQETLVFISNECPNLKTLEMPISWEHPHSLESPLTYLVGKWKRLEKLRFTCENSCKSVLDQIGIHCRDIRTLEVLYWWILEEEAAALIRIPNLKSLCITNSQIEKEHLLMILKGCKRLEYLDARNCLGFDEKDADVLDSTAHLLSVKLEGSKII